MAVAQTDSPSLSLVEVGGIALMLTNRALPYLPLSISGRQRAEFTWYPGSPQATVQMLGPEEGVISLRGYWKDRFIDGTTDAFITGVGARPVTANVATLVKTVDDMRRMGRVIDFEWGDIRRRGHITSFTQTWYTVHDCEWELEFSVSAQENTIIPAGTPPAPSLADAAAQAAADRDKVRDERFGKEEKVKLGFLESFSAALTELDIAATTNANFLISSARNVTAYITAPGDATRRVMATASGYITQLSRFIGTTTDAALTDGYAFANIGGQDTAPFGIQLGAASFNRVLRNTAREIQYNNAILRYNMAQQLNNEVLASYVTPEAADLRDVSTRFYGTPDSWRSLMIYNGLTASQLAAGQLIWIPIRPDAAGAPGLTYGGAA